MTSRTNEFEGILSDFVGVVERVFKLIWHIQYHETSRSVADVAEPSPVMYHDFTMSTMNSSNVQWSCLRSCSRSVVVIFLTNQKRKITGAENRFPLKIK